ncbi:Sec-independent protein translocase subunit TatA [Streptomyces sp. NPDC051243]|uniref:Sec-independent protein translocase subunit TatA n=1 Tax=Streptomyces sp. NPDC051243 TaxID=3365646 RepID=UPI003791A317
MFGLSELAILLIVVILVLGAKRLPDLARSAGRSARILKAEAKAMKEEQAAPTQQAEQTAPRVIEGETITPGISNTTDTVRHSVPHPRTPGPVQSSGPQG